MFTNNNKKGQLEVMGLAVIMILISLAMLFVLQFIITDEGTDIKKEAPVLSSRIRHRYLNYEKPYQIFRIGEQNKTICI